MPPNSSGNMERHCYLWRFQSSGTWEILSCFTLLINPWRYRIRPRADKMSEATIYNTSSENMLSAWRPGFHVTHSMHVRATSISWCKKDVTPVREQWRYIFLALTHRYGNGKCTQFCIIHYNVNVTLHSFCSMFLWTSCVYNAIVYEHYRNVTLHSFCSMFLLTSCVYSCLRTLQGQ